MNWTKHEDFFSAERMGRYLHACSEHMDVAIKLYKYNIKASQALYPILSIFEVSLRNALDRAICKFFNDKDWLITQRANFAYHPLMVYENWDGVKRPDKYFGKKIAQMENLLLSRNTPVTHGKLLSEMNFGFWLKFFDTNAVRVLQGAPLNALINKPTKNLTAIQQHFRSVRSLRNRIAHNESICFNKSGKICLENMANHESKIVEALGWLNTDLKLYSDKLNFYKLIYNRIADLLYSLPPHASSSA